MLRLSHSQKELYMRCPYAYYMHYILGIKRQIVGSALPFGTAIDQSLNELLISKDLDKAKQVFIETWQYQKINNQTEDLSKTSNVRYSKSDVSWANLKDKGLLFLEQYSKQIIPKIKKVIAIQEKISITNSIGDEITGFVDFVAEWEDGRVIIFDNKTATRPYALNVIETEAKQLALYEEALYDKYHNDAVGYLVINKEIRKKKEPLVVIQEIIGKIPQELKDKTIEEFDKTLYNIRMGGFESKHPHCDMPWEKCICADYIASGGSNMNGLIYTGRKNE